MKTVAKFLIGFIAGFATFATILVVNPECARHIDEMVHEK